MWVKKGKSHPHNRNSMNATIRPFNRACRYDCCDTPYRAMPSRGQLEQRYPLPVPCFGCDRVSSPRPSKHYIRRTIPGELILGRSFFYLRASLFYLRLVFVAYGLFGLVFLTCGLVFFAYGGNLVWSFYLRSPPPPGIGFGLFCLRFPPSGSRVWSFCLRFPHRK